MEEIKIYKNIDFTAPIMISGWPGMGNVALGVVEYLHKKLGAVKFAEITVDPMAILDSVVVDKGMAAFPPVPQNTFYYIKNPEMIIFVGEAQLPGRSGIGLLNKMLDFAAGLKVKTIFTGAAFPMPVSYKELPRVYAAVNRKPLGDSVRRCGVSLMDDGHISGMNGLLLGFAKQKNIDAVCLLATMPQYAIGLPNPKASGAVIDVLRKILSFKISFQELGEQIKDVDEKMAAIEEKVGDVLTFEKEEPEHLPSEKKIPAYIMEKIEKLFQETRLDKAKAAMLKNELDRWDLYAFYEDRFLDLFK
ncbi:MAG: PAC2 family protein [Candidatus Omnitrophota bacterium]